MKVNAVVDGRGMSAAEAVKDARERIFAMVKNAGTVDSIYQSGELRVDEEIDGEPYTYVVTYRAVLNLDDLLHNPWDVRCSERVYGEPVGRDAICMVCRPGLAGVKA